mgnify:CR=1 FL=1
MEKDVPILVDSLLESIEVELILDEFLADLAEETVILETTEPLDPSHIHILAEL